jgi:hypothetical protein
MSQYIESMKDLYNQTRIYKQDRQNKINELKIDEHTEHFLTYQNEKITDFYRNALNLTSLSTIV